MSFVVIALGAVCCLLMAACVSQHMLIQQLRRENVKTSRERSYYHDKYWKLQVEDDERKLEGCR